MNYLLMGNGPSATRRTVGALVDAFDGQVVRFNRFQFKNRRKVDLLPLAGSRVDMWATCGRPQDVRSLGQTKNFLAVPPQFKDWTDRAWGAMQDAPQECEQTTQEIFDRTSEEMGSRPSSGALVAAQLLDQGHNVFLYGFDFLSPIRQHHYWAPNHNKGGCHTAFRERAWFRTRINDPDVKLALWAPDEVGHLKSMYEKHYEITPPHAYQGKATALYLTTLTRVVQEAAAELQRPVGSILEFGCGKSSLGLALAAKTKTNLLRYDPALPEFSKKPDSPVDLLFTTDVLEHVPLSGIPEILNYPAEYHFHAICCRPAVTKLPDGSNAHCTVRLPNWWNGFFTAHYAAQGKGTIMIPSKRKKMAIFLSSSHLPI